MKRLVTLLLLLLVAAPATIRAESPADSKPTTEWQNADMGSMARGEQFQSTTLVTGAYVFIWWVVLAFVVTVWRRSQHLARELDTLQRTLDRKKSPPLAAG